jgi:hypothetical protein
MTTLQIFKLVLGLVWIFVGINHLWKPTGAIAKYPTWTLRRVKAMGVFFLVGGFWMLWQAHFKL